MRFPLLGALVVLAAVMARAQGDGPRPSVFHVNFTVPELPASPDHSAASPGPEARGADRAGYTAGRLRKSVGIVWNDDGARDGKVALFAESIQVDYSFPLSIAVSSEYREDGCPYDRTWKHELGHARAMQRLFSQARGELSAALEASQAQEPRVPTKAAPVLLKPDAVAPYQAAVARKVHKLVEERSRAMLALMENDRRLRDAPEEYDKVYDECAGAEWEFRP